jgi:phage terminase large subunit-like protein
VTSGAIPACHWVKQACRRQLDDLERWKAKGSPYQWKPAKANEICAFIELLPHVKGEWAKRREKIHLEDWQCFELCTVFGWYKADGTRRFRTVYLEEPRKNAKSTKSAGVGLYMLTADGEAGAEIYSAATTRDQTRPVFQECAQEMAKREPEFREAFGVEVGAHNIHVVSTASKFEALSADASTLDGLNIHCAIVDGLHAHPTRKVWDVLETATGSRQQPLIWAITTAGTDKAGICYEQRTYVTKILDRVIEDETYFGIIYTIDEGDDPFDPATWRKANPNFGISVKPDDMERKARKAAQLPAALSNFLTKHLNVWVSADAGLFDMLAWERAKDSTLKIEDMGDAPCWIGVDLGFVDDIAAVTLVFKRDDGFAAFARSYLPEETIEESRNSQYSGWHRSGHIEATDGNITDIEVICDDLAADLERYNVQEIAYDPYAKLLLLGALQKRGIGVERVYEFRQVGQEIAMATEEAIKAVKAERIKHNGNPVLTWAMSNVVGHADKNDNVHPQKEKPENKIDPAIALIMAHGRATAGQPAEAPGFIFA